ncbi:MAG TPA: SNF2-related protein, partial [Desulfobacteria bacterium]|nr:SNF2-related protein [Desulfobacteria bacterium]
MAGLISLDELPFVPLQHQISAAKAVIDEMNGRAILADEVGLGKTIEAGLIIRELLARNQVRRVLILTPASLAPQWCMEMKQKFNIYFYHNRKDHNWTYFKFIVASLDRAKRPEQLSEICQAGFDLVVVDEAHRLKNNHTANYRAVQQINAPYLLLLTATPLHNSLKELYNLVELVKPGLFIDFATFQENFMQDDASVTNLEQLQQKLTTVMIRNKKNEVDLNLPKRQVELVPVQQTTAEATLYQAVDEYIRTEYKRRLSDQASILGLITLQREICSSTFAAKRTLEQTGLLDLAALSASVHHNAKAEMAKQIIESATGKVVLFTEFKATQAYLVDYLGEHGIQCLSYNGDLKQGQRIWSRYLFEQEYPVMISTEAGGEGLNLQMANVVINYDLPWNPMRVEQRIGRVHRIGQTHLVKIYNLYSLNTVEEFVLSVLRKKLNLFEETVGALDNVVEGQSNELTEI